MLEEYRVKHILLAEDEDYMRQAIVFILESAGYKVTAVDDGAIALRELVRGAAGGEDYDMLITDLQIPRLLGNDLISMLAQKIL